MPKPKRCPICNRSSDEVRFYGEFCEDCARQMASGKLEDKAEITVCKRCGRVKTPEGFAEMGDESLASAIKGRFKGHKIKVVSFSSNSATLEITDETPYGALSLQKSISIDRKEVICDECYRKASGYYEATIQLRGERQRVASMLARIERYFARRGSYIAKLTEKPNGYDIQLPDKRIAIGFIAAYHLKPVSSYTLYGKKNGKDVYRNTYSLHL